MLKNIQRQMETIDISQELKTPSLAASGNTSSMHFEKSDGASSMEVDEKYKVVIDSALVAEDDPDDDEPLDGHKKKEGTGDDDGDEPWNPSELADLIVDSIGFLQEQAGKYFHHKTLLTAEQRADLKNMILEYGIEKDKPFKATNRKKELNYYEKWLLRKQQEHFEYVEALPFDEDEVTRLKKAWRRYLKGKNVKISDGWALAVTMISVMAPRALGIVANIFDNDKKMMAPGVTAEEKNIHEEVVKVMDDLKLDQMDEKQLRDAILDMRKKMKESQPKQNITL